MKALLRFIHQVSFSYRLPSTLNSAYWSGERGLALGIKQGFKKKILYFLKEKESQKYEKKKCKFFVTNGLQYERVL
jgi:hypothetical protein